MKEYIREYPQFSLCGLKCCLCPQYHAEGVSRCPGCGGSEFHLKHPSCSVINCSRKHGEIQYCFQCVDYPCSKYNAPNEADSFISYKNVQSDFEDLKRDSDQFYDRLAKKLQILEFLLQHYNDGRKKSYYCLAVNLLELEGLQAIRSDIEDTISRMEIPPNEKIRLVIELIDKRAVEEHIVLKLRR